MPGAPRLWAAVVLVGVLTSAWAVPGAFVRGTYGTRVTADEPQYLLSALSLAEDGDLDIADERYAARYQQFHELPLPAQDALGRDGRRVSPHDPLLPLLLALPVRAGGWLGAKLALAAMAGALAGLLVWLAVRRLGVGVVRAAVAVAAFALAPPLSVYATQVYPELPAALAVTVAVAALTARGARRWALALAVAVMSLPWLSVKYAPVAAVLALLGLARLWRAGEVRAAAWLTGGLGAAAVVFLVAHQLLYGGLTPYAAGTHFAGGELEVVGTSPDLLGRAGRLAGLLVDRNFGLAAWHPGWLLAVPAVAALVRRRPPSWPVLALPVAAGWLGASFLALTMHGWWWPGRQVVVVLPLAVLAVSWWAARSRVALVLVAAAGALGAATYAWLVAEGLRGDVTWVVGFAADSAPWALAWRRALPDLVSATAGDRALLVAWSAGLAAVALVPPLRRAGAKHRVAAAVLALAAAALPACSPDDGAAVRGPSGSPLLRPATPPRLQTAPPPSLGSYRPWSDVASQSRLALEVCAVDRLVSVRPVDWAAVARAYELGSPEAAPRSERALRFFAAGGWDDRSWAEHASWFADTAWIDRNLSAAITGSRPYQERTEDERAAAVRVAGRDQVAVAWALHHLAEAARLQDRGLLGTGSGAARRWDLAWATIHGTEPSCAPVGTLGPGVAADLRSAVTRGREAALVGDRRTSLAAGAEVERLLVTGYGRATSAAAGAVDTALGTGDHAAAGLARVEAYNLLRVVEVLAGRARPDATRAAAVALDPSHGPLPSTAAAVGAALGPAPEWRR